MYEYGENHISPEQIKNWLYSSQNADRIFEDYFIKNGTTIPIQHIYGASGKGPQNSIGYEVNTDFRSLNLSYLHLKENLSFSETDWIHPFSDVSIHRHIRYFPPFTHYHDFFELCYVIEGSCDQTLYDRNDVHGLHLINGDILIIPPGFKHSILMNSNSIVVNILIRKSTFKTTFLSNLPANTVLYHFFSGTLYDEDRQSYIHCHTKGDINLQNLFYWIAEEYCNNDIYSNHIINQMLSVFFSTLLRCYGDSMEFIGESSNCLDLIPTILQYMEINYNTTSVQDIADHFNFNTSYLGQVFKEHTHTTLIDALIRVRITKARELLETTSLSVDLIAEMIGYRDTTYFIRLFKKHMGQTPLQYRKSCKK